MPITRTTWIDDDGSGTVGTIINNAEKTVLYNQIDAALAVLTPTYTTVNITDVSGAGLGVLGTARYAVVHSIVLLQIQVIYPATANALAAKIGTLPFPNNAVRPSGFYVVYGPSVVWHVSLSSTEVLALTPGTMAAKTNADLSSSNNALVGFYITV
jgi:hypothetical protein